MGAPRRRRRGHQEEHEGGHSERWLVTYADMVTLLMVLFIVMFSMSAVSEEKYNALKEGLASGFGQSASVLNGASHQLDDDGSVTPASAAYDELVQDLPAAARAALEKALAEADQARHRQRFREAEAEVSRLEEIRRRLDAALRARGLQDDVRTLIDDRGLVVSLVSRHVVFEPNVAELTPRGRRVVDTIAPVLRELTEPLRIDGHTNQVKVKPKYYPTDWDLSSARAIRVLRHLQEDNRLPARRLTASAFGNTKPLLDPATPGSQRVNKRVDIIVLSQAPAQTRALFAQVVSERARAAGAPAPTTPPTDRSSDPAGTAAETGTPRGEAAGATHLRPTETRHGGGTS